MKLSIAIAVLMLVFAAHTEAEEETIEQKFANFGNQMKEMTEDLAVKTKATLEEIHSSDFAVKTRGFFAEQFEKMKKTIEDLVPKDQ